MKPETLKHVGLAELPVFHRGLSFIAAPGRPQRQAIRKRLHQHAF